MGSVAKPRRRYCKYWDCNAEAMMEEADIYLCLRHVALAVDMLQEGFQSATSAWRKPVSPVEAAERAARIKQAKQEFFRNAVVYYVRLGDRIKIGTTISMVDRMRELNLKALEGRVLATEPGSYDQEKRRHKQFAKYRLDNTEFFQPHPDLLAHIEAIRAEHGEPQMTSRIRGLVWD